MIVIVNSNFVEKSFKIKLEVKLFYVQGPVTKKMMVNINTFDETLGFGISCKKLM